MSTSITTTPTTTTAKSSEDQANRYLLLKQRKEALDKKLNEKYEQLHQICQKVSHWVYCNSSRNSFVIYLLGGYTDRQQFGSHLVHLDCNDITTAHPS